MTNPQYVQQHRAALHNAFDKLSAHLRHSCDATGCSHIDDESPYQNENVIEDGYRDEDSSFDV